MSSENGHAANGTKKLLFTPGPLNTSATVKAAMQVDYGSRDVTFIDMVKFIRSELLKIAGCSNNDYATIPLQGSGTYAVESIFSNVIGAKSAERKVLILSNGAYGNRMQTICKHAGYSCTYLSFPEDQPMDLKKVQMELKKQQYHLVAMTHCETSTGIINPIADVGDLVKRCSSETLFAVDAMSSFGAVPVNVPEMNIDFLVSSANKCIEGVPGFCFVIARKTPMLKTRGNCLSLSFDWVLQFEGLEASGQFRFTPPTHAMAAFTQALKEHTEEGGVEGRKKRYLENNRIIQNGMKRMGFKQLLPAEVQSYIITSYYFPNDPKFNFTNLYEELSKKGCVIYPGKTSVAECFRLGNIGQLHPEDCHKLIRCMEETLKDMGINLPVKN